MVGGLILMFCSLSTAKAQLIEYYELPGSLKEISGLEIINDSLLVAFNDGGHDPRYLLNLEGEVVKKVEVTNAKNKDWEDITTDGEYIYIGDVGNNANKRLNLRVYKIKISDILKRKEVTAQTIKFNYGDQRAYPPISDSLFFDAEALAYYQDSIWIFTKNRATNSDGSSRIYKLPTIPGEYTVYQSDKVFIGKNGWLKDGITAVDVYEDDFYILTYNRYMIKQYKGDTFEDVSTFNFKNVAQRESIVVRNSQCIFVADEKNPMLGDVKLYKIRPRRD